jgi:NTE family protein
MAPELPLVNTIAAMFPPEVRSGYRTIKLIVLRPSRDLGKLANEYEAGLPGPFRFLTRGLGTRETRSNDLLSLLMFQPDYLTRLIELGEADAEAQREGIERLLEPEAPR